MREEDVETAIKVVVVGNGAVGKSSMIQRFCKGIFTKDYKKTIGVDFLERQMSIDSEDVRLMLWDTAGQEEFDAITKAYYRGAQACVLCFSTVDRDSYEAIEQWIGKVSDECGTIPCVLVQNKIDLIDEAVVQPEEAESLAKKLRVKFYRTSVKEDLNVTEVFQYLAKAYLENLQNAKLAEEQENSSTNLDIFKGQRVEGKSNGKPNKKDKQETNAIITLRPNKERAKGKKSKCKLL
ncbi:ras-related protein Rab-23-like [Xenia sp. Carnegie-2017]|uniref:ras-related protein Rab-23-like n=1 Tax=Xenia sp. Carnegie-2017 TaxID=2897299 RepID=UPI001F03DFEA|nr:ras-related protein Rab-23-like [Xenia sp. Carnegie-2017]XP_046840300.1 ras-related protein Rab-23-like [Xenia sp. Carnegie-2017]